MNNLPAKIGDLETDFLKYSEQSRDVGNKIASTISMLQLKETKQAFVECVQEMEEMVTPTTNKKTSWLDSIPGVAALRKKKSEIELNSGSMVDNVNRMFKAMSDKQKNILDVMENLFKIKEKLIEDHKVLLQQEAQAEEISQEDNFAAAKARNILVQLKQSILKTQERIVVIDTTIKSAEASSLQISALLPALQGELVTEMSIQAGLQELKEYKQIFDKTVDIVEDVNKINSESMHSVLVDVAELAVYTPKSTKRLEDIHIRREKLTNDLQDRLNQQKANQDKALDVLTTQRQRLGNRPQLLLGEDK